MEIILTAILYKCLYEWIKKWTKSTFFLYVLLLEEIHENWLEEKVLTMVL